MSSIRYLFLVWIFMFFIWIVGATFSVDTFITQFHANSANLTPVEKKSYYTKVYNTMSLLALRNRTNEEQYKLYTSIKEYIKTQIVALNPIASPSVSFSSGMNIPKVDLEKLRQTRLQLHNIEREKKWLTPYRYNTLLEWTATTWANHLANSKKTTWLHKRKNTDPIYSYDSIKQWFLDQWIGFATKEQHGHALFTENLSYWVYTCKKTDCTEDIIKAIKGTGKSWRSFFMSEKWKTYKPHYNAIVGDFSFVGLWIALVGNRYYLVSHYTQTLQ